jgi:hypothetical protein
MYNSLFKLVTLPKVRDLTRIKVLREKIDKLLTIQTIFEITLEMYSLYRMLF